MEAGFMAAQDVLRLDPQEIRARRAQGEDIVFVDVRTQAARSMQPEQIPGTHWLSLAEVVQKAETLPRQSTIAIY